jgi:hypothetical protein
MSPSEKQESKSISGQIDARLSGLSEEQLLQLRSASAQADTGHLAGTSFENSPEQSEAADSGTSPFGSLSAGLESDNAFDFERLSGHPSEEHRPGLVDAVIEQLRQARLKRWRPH